jgi:uncharacterized Tic20 family protein
LLTVLFQESNADIPNHYCLQTIVGGGNTQQIDNACPLTCHEGSRVSFTQINEDILVVSHLPFNGSKVVCDDGYVQEIHHDFDVGALRMTFGCGCKLMINNRVLARSHRMLCTENAAPLNIQHVVPVQMSIAHKDWVPYRNGRLQDGIYTTDDIVDEVWAPSSATQFPSNNEDVSITYEVSVWTILFGIIQWVLFVAFIYRYRLGPFAILARHDIFPLVEAARSDKVTCQLSNDVYIILYSILTLSSIILVHRIVTQVFKVCKDLKNAYFNRELRKAVGDVAMIPIADK